MNETHDETSAPDRKGSAAAPGAAFCTMDTKRYSPARLEPCGAVARYVWTPRNNPSRRSVVCEQCGRGLAGNYKAELTDYEPNE